MSDPKKVYQKLDIFVNDTMYRIMDILDRRDSGVGMNHSVQIQYKVRLLGSKLKNLRVIIPGILVGAQDMKATDGY